MPTHLTTHLRLDVASVLTQTSTPCPVVPNIPNNRHEGTNVPLTCALMSRVYCSCVAASSICATCRSRCVLRAGRAAWGQRGVRERRGANGVRQSAARDGDKCRRSAGTRAGLGSGPRHAGEWAAPQQAAAPPPASLAQLLLAGAQRGLQGGGEVSHLLLAHFSVLLAIQRLQFIQLRGWRWFRLSQVRRRPRPPPSSWRPPRCAATALRHEKGGKMKQI